MYNEHFKIYFIARFFWKIIKIVIIEHYMSILGVIYRNWKQQGRNETNYFMYQWVGPVCSPPHPSELLHLNQASIKNLISDLTRPSVLEK